MKEFNEILQKWIEVEITTEFGHIGTRYVNILAVKDGRIISIGQFIYRLWSEIGLEDHRYGDVRELLEELSKEANKFYNGLRPTMPALSFFGDALKVY